MLRRGSQKVSRDTGFPLFEARDSEFLSKIRARFGIDGICGTELGGGLPKNPRDYGIKEPFWGPFKNDSLLQSLGLHYRSPVDIRFGKLHLNSHFIWPPSNTPAV